MNSATTKYESEVHPKTGVLYDNDSGLLNEIDKLPAQKLPRGRKPQNNNKKWANSEFCSCCAEGGELICCDRCPASFHFMCHDPPIYKEEIPKGKWMCNRCKTETLLDPKAPKSVKKMYNSEQEHDQAVMDAVQHLDDNFDPVHHNQDSDNKVAQENNEAEAVHESKSSEVTENKSVISEAMENLQNFARAVTAINAKQYSLPLDIDISEACPLPYDEISPRKSVENGRCFYCNSGDNSSMMIECDFCQIPFHFDCCNPPLTMTPKERWMCPLHVEPFLDQYFVDTLSLTQRIKLWRKYARQPDVDTFLIALDFCRRARKHKEKEKFSQNNVSHEDTPTSSSCENEQNSSISQKEATFDVGEKIRKAYRLGARCLFANYESGSNNKESKDIDISFEEARDSFDFLDAILKMRKRLRPERNALLEDWEAEQNEIKKTKPEPKEENETSPKMEVAGDGHPIPEASVSNGVVENEFKRYSPKPVAPSFKFDSAYLVAGKPILACLRAIEPLSTDTIPIQSTMVRMGTSLYSTVNLRRIYKTCTRLAYEHATIYFDKGKQCFEIVPSCRAVAVNDVFCGPVSTELDLYDPVDAKEEASGQNNPAPIKNHVNHVKEIDSQKCDCIFSKPEFSAYSVPVAASVILRNGAVIQLGCIKFVFVVSPHFFPTLPQY